MKTVIPIVAGLIAGLIALWFITKKWPTTGKWGINLNRVSCTRCGTRQRAVRMPTSFRQMMWGGWTCKECGCEMDKYGVEIKR